MKRKSNTLKKQLGFAYHHGLPTVEVINQDHLTRVSLQEPNNYSSKIEVGARTVVSYQAQPGVSRTKVTKLLLSIYTAKGSLTLKEYMILESVFSDLMGEHVSPLEIRQESKRILVTLTYLVLKYGGITNIRGSKFSTGFLRDQANLLQLKLIPIEKIPSSIQTYHIKLVLTTLPCPTEKPHRTTKRYSGYCKGHPTPGRSGQPPLELELQPVEEVEPVVLTQKEQLVLFNFNYHLKQLSNKSLSTFSTEDGQGHHTQRR